MHLRELYNQQGKTKALPAFQHKERGSLSRVHCNESQVVLTHFESATIFVSVPKRTIPHALSAKYPNIVLKDDKRKPKLKREERDWGEKDKVLG